MRYARLLEPYKGYWDIQVDEDSITGGYHGYEYNCTVIGSGKEITGNGQSNQLPTNLLDMEEMNDQKKEQIRKLMDKAKEDGKEIDWAKIVLC